MKLKNIKDTFNSREISPSTGSWDQLAGRLDLEENKSKKPVLIYWLGAIAAVLIAALLLYPALTNESSVNQDSNSQIVTTDDPVEQESINGSEDNAVVIIEKNQLIEEKQPSNDEVNKSIIRKPANKILKEQSSITQPSQKQITSNEQKLANQKLQIIENTLLNDDLNEVSKKSTAIALQESKPVIKKSLTVDEEMELLLNNAMGKVKTTEIVTKTVDPNKLLRETEWDIESDQRSKLQNGIQNGLNFLKAEAIAIVEGNK